tara:strand:- start:1258 stop:1605 length:348 start_codon:yes stop_codon:yes gene_type:complete
MKATLTSIQLKGHFKFFALSGMGIIKQLSSTKCKDFKKKGVWTKHYTMTLWSNENELKDFARSSAHLEAMKRSSQIAKEIRTITIDTDTLPDWEEAKKAIARWQSDQILNWLLIF